MNKPPAFAMKIFKLFMGIHVWIYRLTKGKWGSVVRQLPVLLLTTTGRKTGKKRTLPLGYFEHDNGYVIIGSNGGMDTHTAWVHNLKSHPRATIEVKDQQFEVSAEIAESEKRNQLWARLMELSPGYSDYSKATMREIPMVILRPVKG